MLEFFKSVMRKPVGVIREFMAELSRMKGSDLLTELGVQQVTFDAFLKDNVTEIDMLKPGCFGRVFLLRGEEMFVAK